MNHPGARLGERRRFLISGLSLLGCTFSLASAAMLSGCSDEKAGGQLENPGDVTKTPDAMDSMKAYQGQMKERKKPSQRR
jgi:hypothetical protein